jgi:hypothetical protein
LAAQELKVLDKTIKLARALLLKGILAQEVDALRKRC